MKVQNHRRNRAVLVALALLAVLSGLPFGAAPARAIPTLHEIKANWVGNPTSVKLGTVANAEFHVNTNDANVPAGNAMVDNVTVTITATNGKFASIPSSCQKTGVTPLSSISADGLTLICNLGTVKEGTATVIQAPLRATAQIAGSMLSASGTVTSDSAVAPAGPASVTPIPITYTNGLDLVLNYTPPQNYQGYQQLDENGNLRQVMRVPWSLVLKDGSLPGPANYSFPLRISSATPGAKVTGLTFERCNVMSTGIPAQGHPSSHPSQPDRTNFPGCAATGSNLNWTINLTGLDYTLTRVPVNDTFGNPLPGGGSYIASGLLEFSIPGTTPVTATYTYTATPPAVTYSNGQTLAEGPTANNDSAVTLYTPGDFSNAWHGTPAVGRSPWDDRLILTQGAGMDIPLPAPDGTPAGDSLPLYSQASSYAWNDYTGAGTTNRAGVCTMKTASSFVYDKADFFGYNPGVGYVNMSTARLYYTTAPISAAQSKTLGCDEISGWTAAYPGGSALPPAGTVAGDPRANNTYLTDIPNNVTALWVRWNPAVDQPVYVGVRGFGYISPTAAVPSEGWTVGSFNRPTDYTDYINNSDISASVTLTPWSNYADGTNGYRDVYRIVGYEGIIEKAAADTSAAPGVPVDFTITAQASSTAANPLPVTFTVVDTIPTGMTYVAGSATPTPYQISPDGRTITWRFVSATPNVDYTITYKAQTPLGSTLPPGTELTNKAVINVTGDPRPVEDRPFAEATVVVPNNGSTILGKSASDNVLSFYGDSSSWKLVINSFDPSSNAWTDTIDVLPYKGDPRGSNFDGTYTIGAVTAPAGSTIYYTTAPPATLSEDPRDPSNGNAPHSITGNTVGWTTVKPAKPTAIRIFGPALAPGTVQTITINYTTPAGTNCVTPAAGDNKPAQTLVNSATTYAAHTALPMKSSASTVIGDCYALDLVKSVLEKGGDPAVEADWHDADAVADYPQYADGDTAPYRIVVTNKGTGTLTNVAVTDSLYPNCNTPIPSLAAGVSQTIFCDGVVHTGTTVNTATATADPADGPNLTASDPAGVVVPQPFVVQKVSSPPTGSNAKPGDTVTYTITITEPSTSPAPYTNPSITDDLTDVLDSADYVVDSESASFGTVDVTGNTLNWSAPQLMPGQTVTITYQVTVKPLDALGIDGDLINGVTGGTCVTATDPACNSKVYVPSYTVTKSSTPASGSTVTPGTVVTYNVVVTNTGQVPVLATLADDLPAVLDDAVYNNDAAATPGGPTPNVSGSNLTWNKTLAVGEVVTLTYSVTVKSSAALGDGKLDNVVTATGDTKSCQLLDPACTTHHDIAAIRYEKVVDDPGVLNILDGQVFQYTITATNVGNVSLGSSVGRPIDYTDDLTEVIDDAVYNNDAIADIGSVTFNAPDQLAWTAPLLNVGQTATITYSVTVDNDIPGGNNVLINAIIGTGPESNCVPDPLRPECTTQVPKPLLQTVKEVLPTSVAQAGGTINYRITTTNIGPTSPARCRSSMTCRTRSTPRSTTTTRLPRRPEVRSPRASTTRRHSSCGSATSLWAAR